MRMLFLPWASPKTTPSFSLQIIPRNPFIITNLPSSLNFAKTIHLVKRSRRIPQKVTSKKIVVFFEILNSASFFLLCPLAFYTISNIR
jgi:hypothetical protein